MAVSQHKILGSREFKVRQLALMRGRGYDMTYAQLLKIVTAKSKKVAKKLLEKYLTKRKE